MFKLIRRMAFKNKFFNIIMFLQIIVSVFALNITMDFFDQNLILNRQVDKLYNKNVAIIQNFLIPSGEEHNSNQGVNKFEGALAKLKNVKATQQYEHFTIKNFGFINVLDGEFACIMGKSGSGKTTLLNVLIGLQKATKGVVEVEGEQINTFNDTKLSSYRSNIVGYIMQDYMLIDEYTVWENVMMPLFFKKMKFIAKKEMVTNVLQKIGIYDLVNKQTSVLSGGEKQRVAIARALINNPDIILADEPTGNLDKENSILIFELLQKISKEG
ncbi:MAG: ATP-binding cassette domain-containing protein, partial [Clostridia bacterium]